VIRLLQNREGAMPRADLRSLATNAYDLRERTFEDALEAAVENGDVEETSGGLRTVQSSPFVEGRVRAPAVDARGVVEGARRALEQRLYLVVSVLAVDPAVEREARVRRQRPEEVPRHHARELADARLAELPVELVQRPPGDVDDDARHGLVQRDAPVREPLDAALLAEGLVEGLSECDADVLDGVVVVYLEVAVAAHGQVEEAVPGERRQHVVEEADAGVHRAVAVAVHVESHLDVRLGRLPGHGRSSVGHDSLFSRSHKVVPLA